MRRSQLVLGLKDTNYRNAFQKRPVAVAAILLAQAIDGILNKEFVFVKWHGGAGDFHRPSGVSVGSGLGHSVDVGLGPERLHNLDDRGIGRRKGLDVLRTAIVGRLLRKVPVLEGHAWPVACRSPPPRPNHQPGQAVCRRVQEISSSAPVPVRGPPDPASGMSMCK
jgi:hypothetical protein